MKPFPYLETFLEAAERGTFTAAARQLGLTQAAVSQRIHQLETALDTSLFRRVGGGVSLTDAGRRLHEYARRIDDLAAEAWAAVTGRSMEPGGELVLAASSIPGQYLLPPTLAVFRKRHPQVRLRVSVSDTDEVLRQVGDGSAHLGLVGGRGGGPHLEFRRFACDELVLVVPRGHAWWRKREIALSDLLAQPLIQREPGSGSRRCLERSLDRLGVAPSDLNVVLELGSTEAIKEAVRRRVGVAVLSRRAVAKEVKAKQFNALHVRGLTLDRDIFLVRDQRRPPTAPVRLFLALVNPEPERPAADGTPP
jgi:DNA-binding transcriptional LysR family regulator